MYEPFRSIDFVQLRHALAVAEHGSFSRAAAVVGLTQPGLTKSIRRLEDRLGAKLFSRGARGVDPTDMGAKLVAHARVIAAQVDDLVGDVGAIANGEAGTIRVGGGPSWLSRYLPLVIARLTAQRTALRVRVVGGFQDRLMEALAQGELDLVVAALPEHGSDEVFECVPLTHDLLQVVARDEHPLRRRRRLRPKDLDPYGWVLPGRDVATRLRLEALFRTHGLRPPEPHIVSDSISFILATLRVSDCLGFATDRLMDREEAKGLATLEVEGLSLRREAGIIYRRRSLLSQACQTLIAELHSLCQELDRN